VDKSHVNILLVDDDEDDYLIFRKILSKIPGRTFDLQWVSTYSAALEIPQDISCDIIFIDYVLGRNNGLELMRELLRKGMKAPIILLTGQGNRDVDIQAMKDGAADYLEKANLNVMFLERSVRYTLERSRTLERLLEREDQLRKLSKELVDAQEDERRRISHELHDSIGSNLSAIKYALEDKLFRMDGKEVVTKGISLKEIITWIQHTIQENQRIYTDLRPSVLDDLGIIATVRWLCRRFEEVYSDIRVEVRLDLEEDLVPEPLKVVLYRIVQEALNNVAKHSGAETVDISLTGTTEGLELLIKDDGMGFDMASAARNEASRLGLGLEGMRDRTEISSGRFELQSAPGQGTLIRCCWALP
jgi:signal transduction histidine kinase